MYKKKYVYINIFTVIMLFNCSGPLFGEYGMCGKDPTGLCIMNYFILQ